MSQCVSCNDQPNNNDSLGGGASGEGAVTPVVIGIIVGTIAVFILVLFALFYCVKIENERSMRVKDEDEGEHETPSQSPSASGDSGTGGTMGPAPAPVPRGPGWENHFGTDKSDDFGGRECPSPHIAGVADRESRGGATAGTAGAVVGKRRGVFGWGGKKGVTGEFVGLSFLFSFFLFFLFLFCPPRSLPSLPQSPSKAKVDDANVRISLGQPLQTTHR